MLENIDDGILDQPPADAGYHASQDSKESCRTCVHYSGRYCDLWDAKVDPKMVCGVWDSFSQIKISMSEHMMEDPTSGPGENDVMDHEDDSKDGLTDRQEAIYEVVEQIVYSFGKFDQSAGADGAHYADKSPFGEMRCSNCVFFRGAKKCEIVLGNIEPEGVCKFWIIPEKLLPANEISPEDDAKGEDTTSDSEMND